MIVSRKEAIQQNLVHYFTGQPCKNGHIDYRFVSSYGCVSCYKMEHRKDRKLSYDSGYRDKHREKRRKQQHSYYLLHKEKYRLISATYHANKLKATPPWVSKQHKAQMEDIYRYAQELIVLTGIEYHVDHIEPLNGKSSCGLHVPWNLQVITKVANCSKRNSLAF